MSATQPALMPEPDDNASVPVTLAFFHSPRSGKSRRVEGYLSQVLQRRRNYETFKLLRVDVDARPDLATRFRVTTVPTLVVVSEKRVCARLSQPNGCHQIQTLLTPWLK